MEEAFAQAVTLHQNGNLEEAEDIYRAVLDADPEHADATNLLCVLAADRGYHDDAIDLIGQAIEYQPENPFYFFSLGNVFMCQDLYDDAAVCYKQSLELRPHGEPEPGHRAARSGEVYRSGDCLCTCAGAIA